MINGIKKLAYKLLGQEKYLRFLQLGFYRMYAAGLLKNDETYKFHYFVQKLIKPGDTILDLGANLGYFSKIFATLTGSGGRVIAIEPVVPFFNLLKAALQSYPQCQFYNYALGSEEKKIKMTVPRQAGYLRTGLAHIKREQDEDKDNYTFEVEMKRGSVLLKNLEALHYIKCDIEGYEDVVLPEIKDIIQQHRPLLQVETWGNHKSIVNELMGALQYNCYMLIQNKLIKKQNEKDDEGYVGDFLFVPFEKEKKLLQSLS